MDLTIRVAEPGEYAVLGEIIAEAYLGDDLLDGPQDPYLLKTHRRSGGVGEGAGLGACSCKAED